MYLIQLKYCTKWGGYECCQISDLFFFKVAYVTKVDFNYKKNSLESIPKIILSPTIKWLIWQWNPDIFLHKFTRIQVTYQMAFNLLFALNSLWV